MRLLSLAPWLGQPANADATQPNALFEVPFPAADRGRRNFHRRCRSLELLAAGDLLVSGLSRGGPWLAGDPGSEVLVMTTDLYLTFPRLRKTRVFAPLLCVFLFASAPLRAGETIPQTNADGQAVPGETAPEEPALDNWIELGVGGTIINGDAAQF